MVTLVVTTAIVTLESLAPLLGPSAPQYLPPCLAASRTGGFRRRHHLGAHFALAPAHPARPQLALRLLLFKFLFAHLPRTHAQTLDPCRSDGERKGQVKS